MALKKDLKKYFISMRTCFIYDDQLTESLIFITSTRCASFVLLQSLVIKKN